MKRSNSTPPSPKWPPDHADHGRFIASEATAFAMAAFLIYLLFWLRSLGRGYHDYLEFIELTKNPVAVFVLSLIFGAVLYNSFTWFNLTPKIMPMYVAEKKVPDVWAAIIAGYLPWAAVTAVALWGVLRWTG